MRRRIRARGRIAIVSRVRAATPDVRVPPARRGPSARQPQAARHASGAVGRAWPVSGGMYCGFRTFMTVTFRPSPALCANRLAADFKEV
jgi:hypothetical protein